MRGCSFAAISGALLAISAGALLAGCASVTDQPREEVRVRVGTGPVQRERAANYASLYLPYAMISSLAYARAEHRNADLCPDLARLDRQNDAALIAALRTLHARNWHCVLALSETMPCPRKFPGCNANGIPDMQVWRRDPNCSEIAIAFRGLNLSDGRDWALLRWLLPILTPAGQLQAHVDGLIARSGCRGANTRVVAVGHSLGGGLAEQTAYAAGRFRYVYGFNAFPAIGFVNRDPATDYRSRIGLGVDNIYEAGEIVGFARVLRDYSSCNPRVRSVQFNLSPVGLAIEKHRLATFTVGLAEISRGGKAHTVTAYREAAGCATAAAGR